MREAITTAKQDEGDGDYIDLGRTSGLEHILSFCFLFEEQKAACPPDLVPLISIFLGLFVLVLLLLSLLYTNPISTGLVVPASSDHVWKTSQEE